MHEDSNRDNYWSRIYFESYDQQKKSVVLICASREYLWDIFRARNFEEVKLEQWFKNVIKKWESLGEEIFKKEIHYDVYAETPEGEINGLEFLEKEITP